MACAAAGSLAVVAFLAGSASFKIVSMDPSEGDALSAHPVCNVHFFGLPLRAAVEVDGHALPSELDLAHMSLSASLGSLPEGAHHLRVELGSAFRTETREADFVIDTTPPTVTHLTPRSGGVTQESSTNLAGVTEPNAVVTVLDGSGKTLDEVRSDGEGAFTARVALADGANKLEVRSRDRAGNRTEVPWQLFSDRTDPVLALSVARHPVEDGAHLKVDALSLDVQASDDDRVARAAWALDGSSPHKIKLIRHGREWLASLPFKELPEGDRLVNVTVWARSGRATSTAWHFNVDSTEELGKKIVTLGARGKDVEALQKRLIEANTSLTDVNGVFDEETETAVRQFQNERGIEPADGIVGPATLSALGPRIFVNLARLELVLDRPGKDPVRYRVAAGMDGHGTPTGKFTIVDMEANPPWLPPKSPWAKNAKVIPPGPGNPLGTRWMGLDHGGVGIHGTNAPWSIGSRASHGCIRMTIPDIESLFAKVSTGTPVEILANAKANPAAERFWP